MHWLDSSRFIESDFFFIHETLKVSVPNRLWGAGWEIQHLWGFPNRHQRCRLLGADWKIRHLWGISNRHQSLFM